MMAGNRSADRRHSEGRALAAGGHRVNRGAGAGRMRQSLSEISSMFVSPTGRSKTISPRAMATTRLQDWKM